MSVCCDQSHVDDSERRRQDQQAVHQLNPEEHHYDQGHSVPAMSGRKSTPGALSWFGRYAASPQVSPLPRACSMVTIAGLLKCCTSSMHRATAVKTAMQSSDTNKRLKLRDAIRSIYNSGGIEAFFRGIGSSTVRAVLVTSSRMLAYEKTIQLLNNNWQIILWYHSI